MGIARRILLAMALVVSATLLVPAAPASAGGRPVTVCFKVGEFGGRPIFDCHTILLPEFKPVPIGPIECLTCPPVFDLWDRIDPEWRFEYLDRLGRGLSFLGEAAQAVDPVKAKQLRELATENFWSAAKLLNGSEVKLGQVGWADLKNEKFHGDPDPQPSLVASGENLVVGLALMQKALGDPHPEPNIEAAMARFDQAYKDLGVLFAG
ncbi:hypothetical protein SAMN05443287_10194 [Micromonospora phaseoli]|uniref:Uncharacterized protein n=2 Tax=Micromonospora phaseoli TaxID=1144548 RepID=A0A1H6R7Q4_9ACTN|nr:hypothetical protein [Micromonospora phaseoli]PZW03352.1 hypothetical protein CLV64_10194 [Micromonospora phaseoli]GIJ78313.1 hypothetical protein Xph01_27450 [Micromonospora phaseoli]SEI51928.1 hypothetical protein SAMN05443287_10194 [Micromonospora phaseoli]